MCSNHSTLIIYSIWLKLSDLVVHYSLSFTAYKAASGGVFLRCGTLSLGYNCTAWPCAKMVSTVIIDEVYYMKFYCWAWLWWKILDLFFFFFFLFYIFVCCIPNYTMLVYLLEFKKIISFSYKEDLVSRYVYIDIKIDHFVYMYITLE